MASQNKPFIVIEEDSFRNQLPAFVESAKRWDEIKETITQISPLRIGSVAGGEWGN